MKFYLCPKCGSILTSEDNNEKCCGENLKELIPNITEASKEKHVPVYVRNNDEILIKVGEIEHPMEDNHYITSIFLVSGNKVIKKELKPKDKPEAKMPYLPGSIIYAYCNNHGLWKSEVQ